jgi:two-component system response regulator NreC
MSGGTLIVSRMVHLHGNIKKHFEALGFADVTVTAEEKNSLNRMIRDLNPGIVIMDSHFYQCCTPVMIADLHRLFPKLNIAVVSTGGFPADRAMYCIVNGARAYVNLEEGSEQFYKGLEEIRNGKTYVSPEVQKRFDIRSSYPMPSKKLTAREEEVIRLLANGYKGEEIADALHISLRTVDAHKVSIYNSLCVRNENEVIRAAIYLGIIDPKELDFYGRDYALNPKPEKIKRRLEKSCLIGI